MNDQVARIAASAMGGAPQGGQPAVPPQNNPAAEQGQPKVPAPKTDQEKALDVAGPKNEGDAKGESPVAYTVEINGQKRVLTPEQIAGTMSRYNALNFKHSQLAPVIKAVESIMKDGGKNPEEIAEMVMAMTKAGQANPTMGGVDTKAPEGSSADMDEALTRWEQENAVSLPPGFREATAGTKAMTERLAKLESMLAQVLSVGREGVIASDQNLMQAKAEKMSAVQQMIANNLNSAQQSLQLADDTFPDFQAFIGSRGYAMEDFADPQLTLQVMQDFKNSIDSPEMARMREIALKRQAYTGSIGAAPSAGAPNVGGAQDANRAFIDRMAGQRLANGPIG